jgi:hypothetical protein
MIGTTRSALVVALGLATAPFLLACGGGDDAATEELDTPAAEETAPAALRVTEVQVGNSIGADRRVTAAATEFAATDTIYASVATEGSASGATLTARWTFEDGQTVDETTQTINSTGPAVTEFHISKPDGWPAGRYRVEILLNGSPTESKEFTIRS